MHLVTYSWMAVVLGVACAAIGWLGLAGWLAVVLYLLLGSLVTRLGLRRKPL